MRKFLPPLIVLTTIVALMAITAISVLAAGPSGPSGKSHTGHLYLYEKNPDSWEITEDGAWGKMKYDLYGPIFKFVFNGHGLEPGLGYTLLYYPDPWPGDGLISLGSGTVNDEGNVHIAGSVDTSDLPAEYDENEGTKIWLVLSGDVDTENQMMLGWNPTDYLFEYDLITYDDNDEEEQSSQSATTPSDVNETDEPDKPNKPDKPDKPDKSGNNNGKKK